MPIKQTVISWARKNPGFMAAVVVPTVAAGLYWGVWASNQYISEAKVTVKQSSDSISAAAGLASLFGRSDTSDAFILQNQVISLDMLLDMERDLGVRKMWSTSNIDFWARLSPSATQEEFADYFRKHVVTELDETHGILTIRVKGFDPDQALQMSRYIVAKGEKYINDLSHRIAEEQVAFVRKELDAAQEKYQTAQAKMVEFQNRYRLLDPVSQAKAVSSLAIELQGQISRTEAELTSALGYLSPTAPQIITLKTKLAGLKSQMNKELGVVAGSGNPRLNALAVQFRTLEVEAGFAENNLKAVLAALEQTRVESAKKLKHVVVVTAPHKAQESEYPKRLYMIASVFLTSLVLYGIGRWTVSTIKDHRG
ncbi:MAG: hypothetical protein AB7U43_03030 [Desulfobacter sp.]